MINLLITEGEVSYNSRGFSFLVCTEELCAIDYLRDRLSEQLGIGKNKANEMIMESLQETVKTDME